MSVFKKKAFFLISILFVVGFGFMNCTKKTKDISENKVEDLLTEIEVFMEISDFEVSMQKQGLVNIKDLDSTLIVDLKYSTTDNFFGEDIYGVLESAYLQRKPAEALKKANELLKVSNPNLRLLIYDAARPLAIQQILWEKLDSIPPKNRKNFVADPAEGSLHNYGCAVDLTIFDTFNKEPLDMGTKYDYFGHLAYPRFENKMLIEGKLSKQQIANRTLLRKVMKSVNYEPITSEWWHFNFYSRKVAKEYHEIVK